MGGLSQESSDLPLASGLVPGRPEATERIRRRYESVVGVESFSRAGRVVAVFEHLVEE